MQLKNHSLFVLQPHTTRAASHDFELQLLRLVRHLLRQGVQTQIEITDGQNGSDQDDADNDHQGVGVTWSGDEA